MSVAKIKGIALPLFAMLTLAGGTIAYAGPIVVNGNFSPPASSPVSWGTLSPGGGGVGGPGTVTWGPDQYGYLSGSNFGWNFSTWISGVSGSGIADQGSAFGFTPPPSGAQQVAFVQAVTGNASIGQTINDLTVGDKYNLVFSLEGRPGTGGAITTVTIGGTTLLLDVTPGNNGWTTYDETFTATSTSELLDFLASANSNNGDSSTGISGVYITPEPGTLLLLGTGLLGFAGLARRLFGMKKA